GQIVLYGLGGLALPAGRMRTRWQHVIVCLAGPGAGFLFLGLVILCLLGIAPDEWENLENLVRYYLNLAPDFQALVGHSPKREIIEDLFWINLMWGLVNLLPIWPLDGGQISRDVLTMVSPRSGASAAYGISLVFAGLLAVNALVVKYGGKNLPPGGPPRGVAQGVPVRRPPVVC